MNFVDGEILYLDKPLGWTSFDVVKRVRSILLRRLGMKKLKVGHAGTLDPLATGVVIVTTGRSTRLIEQLQAGVKEYVATIAIGATTPSFDLETDIDALYPAGHVTEMPEQWGVDCATCGEPAKVVGGEEFRVLDIELGRTRERA